MSKIKLILPGEIFEEEFLIPIGISPYKLAKDIKISATRVSEIIKGKRQITIDTALRLSKYFGNSVEFWVGIQADYEIRKTTGADKSEESNDGVKNGDVNKLTVQQVKPVYRSLNTHLLWRRPRYKKLVPSFHNLTNF